jgi:hypothetical protein
MAFDESFTTTDSSGATIELLPGGSEMRVSYESALQYAELIERARLNECTEAYKCMRKGMSAVIPIDLLNLFSWK